MNEVITLYLRTPGTDDVTKRDVLAGLHSIGMTEFYQANAQGIHPEVKFVLADYLDYNGETLLRYGEECYRVLRTFRKGQELEITVTRASVEEAELCE